MNLNQVRKNLVPKVTELAKRHGFDFIWIDPLTGSDTLYRKGGGTAEMFISSLERYYIEEMDRKQWIEMIGRSWYNVSNFLILDLLKLIEPLKEKYGIKTNYATGGKIQSSKRGIRRVAQNRKTKR